MQQGASELIELNRQIVGCTKCPRLVQWREKVARDKVKRFADEEYWGKPVPGFGDPSARLLIVGLAPAAHGANRTGRMFTGDRSGDWLYRTLHKFDFANQPQAKARDDGLVLNDCYITASVRCAPPQNKPSREEKDRCFPYLLNELKLLKNARVVIALGKVGFDTIIKAFGELNRLQIDKRPVFGHGNRTPLNDHITLIASYHPSQQNTFTGKLTQEMFDTIFRQARQCLASR